MAELGTTLREVADTRGPQLDAHRHIAVDRIFGDRVSDVALTALTPFVPGGDLQYWCPDAFRLTTELLADKSRLVSPLITAHRGEVDHAVQAMCRWTTRTDTASSIGADTSEGLALLEDDVIPGYLRLAEQIYEPLSGFLISLAKSKSSKLVGPPPPPRRPLWLLNHDRPALQQGYDPFIRNSIAHGGWRFVDGDVELWNGTSNQLVSPLDLLRSLHQLRRTCTAVCAGLIAYSATDLRGSSLLLPALGRFVLNGLADHTWDIRRIHEVGGEQSKLIIDANTTETNSGVVGVTCLKIMVRADEVFGHHYDRIKVSLDTGADVAASAYASTKELRTHLDDDLSPGLWKKLVTFLPFGTNDHARTKLGNYIEGAKQALSVLPETVGREFRARNLMTAIDAFRLQVSVCDRVDDGVSITAFAILRPHVQLSAGLLEAVAGRAIRDLRKEKYKGWSLTYAPHRKPVRPSVIRLFVVRKPSPLWLLDRLRVEWSRNVVATALWHRKNSSVDGYYYSWERAQKVSNFAFTSLYDSDDLDQLDEWSCSNVAISSGRVEAKLVSEEGYDGPQRSGLKLLYVVPPDLEKSVLLELLDTAVKQGRRSRGFSWRENPNRLEVRMGYDATDLRDDAWGWVGRATWSLETQKTNFEARVGASSLEQAADISRLLGLEVTIVGSGIARISLSRPHGDDDAVDALTPVDAAVKLLSQADRFLLDDGGVTWGEITRTQWRRADVSRSSMSAFCRARNGLNLTVEHVSKRVAPHGTLNFIAR